MTTHAETTSEKPGLVPQCDQARLEASPEAPQSPESQEEESSEEKYPSGIKFFTLMVAVCLSFILVGLDSNILPTAVPSMTRHFGTIADIGWYTSIYRLAAGSFQLMFGKLYNLFPAKPIVLASLGICISGSLLCALAPTSPVFVFGRAVVGFATAGIISGAFAIIIQITPLRKRPTYAGIGAATEAVAALTAPLIGGILTDRLSWRWCFFIELPLIASALAIVFFYFDSSEEKKAIIPRAKDVPRQLDLAGTLLFVPAFAALILALQWGGTKYNWSDWHVLVPLGAFVLLMSAFGWLQTRLQDKGTLPPRILLQRNVLFGFLFAASNNGALSIIEYYMPIYFQTVKELSASMSGVMVLPSAAGLIISVPLAGFLTSYFGYYTPFMILNGALTPVATGLLTTLDAKSQIWSLIMYQALLGFGAGIGFQGPQVAVQATFSDADSQIGIAIIQLAQGIGPAIFVAAAQTIFSSRLDSAMKEYAPSVDLGDLSGQGLTVQTNGTNDYDGVIKSYGKALNETFYLSVALACTSLLAALCMEWRSLKKDKPSHK